MYGNGKLKMQNSKLKIENKGIPEFLILNFESV
jgi:hypothetical protein